MDFSITANGRQGLPVQDSRTIGNKPDIHKEGKPIVKGEKKDSMTVNAAPFKISTKPKGKQVEKFTPPQGKEKQRVTLKEMQEKMNDLDGELEKRMVAYSSWNDSATNMENKGWQIKRIKDINFVYYENEHHPEWCGNNSTRVPCLLFATKFS